MTLYTAIANYELAKKLIPEITIRTSYFDYKTVKELIASGIWNVLNKLSDIQMKVTGRGGTAFSPVIDYINNDKYYRDALLIYFTDGYGEKKIKKPLTYKNLWVILGNEKDLSLKEPYGIVVAMHTYEGDY